jgi:hypothetical protein
MKKYNITVFRKVLNDSLNEDKGFEVIFYDRWRGVTNFRTMINWLDKNVPDWWYVNVYLRPSKDYKGRIYTDTRRYRHYL